MLSYNTNIVKSIQTVELFQLFQIIIIQDITNFCSFKNENIFRSFTTTKELEFNFKVFSPPQQQPLRGAVRKETDQV